MIDHFAALVLLTPGSARGWAEFQLVDTNRGSLIPGGGAFPSRVDKQRPEGEMLADHQEETLDLAFNLYVLLYQLPGAGPGSRAPIPPLSLDERNPRQRKL